MADSPVKFASGVESLTVEFTNSARDAAGNITYNVESDLSGDPVADYKLLRAIMDGDTDIFSSSEFSGLDPSEIDALETRLTELAVADQDMVANGLTRWIVSPMYQNNFNAGLGGPSFHTDDFNPASLNRNIGEQYIGAIQKAVGDMHQNGVPQAEAMAALNADSENVLNEISAQIENQMNAVREFAVGNDVVATIVDAGAEITGASPVGATVTNDPQAMYELFRNLEDTDLAASPVYLALDAAGQETLNKAMMDASHWDHHHVTGTILNYIQAPGHAHHYIGDQINVTFQDGNFDRVNPNRDLGQDYINLIQETVEKFQNVDYDRALMAEINADFSERANEIKQSQVEMVNEKFDDLAVHDQTHDVVALSVPTR